MAIFCAHRTTLPSLNSLKMKNHYCDLLNPLHVSFLRTLFWSLQSFYCLFVQKYHCEIKLNIKRQLTPTFFLYTQHLHSYCTDKTLPCFIFKLTSFMCIFRYLQSRKYWWSSMVTSVQHIPHNKCQVHPLSPTFHLGCTCVLLFFFFFAEQSHPST